MTSSDEAAFASACEVHRKQLRLHCYRMTGSVDDADELVQETLLRAWRSRATFEGRAQLGTWLHRIATNACLDALARRPPRVLPQDVVRAVRPDDEPRGTPPLRPDLPWLQPVPDALLDPESLMVGREQVELAFLAALQHLPGKPRAALILCDVLGWSAKDVAEVLELTVAAVTSALQRARATMKALAPSGRDDWTPLAPPSEAERALLGRYIAAWNDDDPSALLALVRDDVRWAMPPAALWFEGRAMVAQVLARYPMRFHGHHRFVPVGANGQLAAATYMRPHGATAFAFSGVHLLRVEGEQIAEITSFAASLCKSFERPMSLAAAPV